MKKLFFLIIILSITMACDDGDLIVEDFNFENTTTQSCDPEVNGSNFSYTFYNVSTTNQESISITATIANDIFANEGTYGPYTLGTTNLIEYRKFNGAPSNNYYCSSVPPASPQVINSYTSMGGTFTFETSTQLEDDLDGIPNDLEPENLDTDGDGIPDFKDFDDDGDNVPTAQEGVVILNGQIDVAQSRDTDSDGILDYLDNDDDGDGTLTIQEDINGNLDPTDDDANGLPAYLNSNFTTAASPAINNYREHSFQRTTRIKITAQNLTLVNGNQQVVLETYPFGVYVRPVFQVLVTPDF